METTADKWRSKCRNRLHNSTKATGNWQSTVQLFSCLFPRANSTIYSTRGIRCKPTNQDELLAFVSFPYTQDHFDRIVLHSPLETVFPGDGSNGIYAGNLIRMQYLKPNLIPVPALLNHLLPFTFLLAQRKLCSTHFDFNGWHHIFLKLCPTVR